MNLAIRRHPTPGDILQVRCTELRWLLSQGCHVDECHELVCEIHGLTLAATYWGQGALA